MSDSLKDYRHGAQESAATTEPQAGKVWWRMRRQGQPRSVRVRAQLFFEARQIAHSRLPGDGPIEGEVDENQRSEGE